MIAFWAFFFGVLAGFVIGAALRPTADELATGIPATLPPATSRRIKRAQRSARADLRRALGRLP